VRRRAESRKLVPPPLHLRGSVLRKASTGSADLGAVAQTPSQTLFVFPPSPTLTTRTPSAMTLMSHHAGPVPFPSLSTPRVSTFHSKGRTRSFIGLGAPPTPTVAFSKVDVRGYVGLQ
jgi:tyrosine-protein phosphatase